MTTTVYLHTSDTAYNKIRAVYEAIGSYTYAARQAQTEWLRLCFNLDVVDDDAILNLANTFAIPVAIQL